MFRFSKLSFLFLSIFFIVSCGGGYNLQVDSWTAVKGNASLKKRYKLFPIPEPVFDKTMVREGPLFNENAELIHSALQKQGYINVNDDSPEIFIGVEYGFRGEPQTITSMESIPQYGQTGIASSSTIGSMGYGGVYSGMTTYRPSYGVTGYTPVVNQQTYHDKYIILVALDVSKPESKEPYWTITIQNNDTSNNLRQRMPYLVTVATSYLGKVARGEEIMIQVDDDRVKTLLKNVDTNTGEGVKKPRDSLIKSSILDGLVESDKSPSALDNLLSIF